MNNRAKRLMAKDPVQYAKTAYRIGVEDTISLIEELANKVSDVGELIEVLTLEKEGLRIAMAFNDKESFQIKEKLDA